MTSILIGRSHLLDPLPERLIVIGGGGHASVVCAALRQLLVNSIEIADPAKIGTTLWGLAVVGGDDWVLAQNPAEVALVNAIGSTTVPDARAVVFQRFKAVGFDFVTLVHPSAILDESVSLGEGAQIMAGSVIQAGVTIGANVLVNTGARIDHDSVISPNCHVAPGVTICGGVQVGQGSHVGAGSTVVQSRKVGSGCLIAAGSVVVRDVPDGAMVRGNPATPFQAQRDDE